MEIFSNKSVRSKILSYIYILDNAILHSFFDATKDYEYKYEMLDNKARNSFEQVVKWYKKEKNNSNNLPSYPFDIFGTDVFREEFLSKQSQKLKNTFILYLKSNLFIFIKDFKDFKNKIATISLLRHYFEHNNLPKEETITVSGIEKELNVEESLKNLFLFLPNVYINDIKLLFEREKNNGKFDYNIEELFKSVLSTKSKNVKTIFENHYNKKEIDLIKDNRMLLKSLQTLKISNCLERQNFINSYNLNKIDSILKTLLGKKKYSQYRKLFYLEEKEKIFMLFIKISEILQKHFVYNYENIKCRSIPEKITKIRNQISHGKIFFYNESDATKSFFDTFRSDLLLILDFFDNNFENAKELKINLLKALMSLFLKKDNIILLSEFEKHKKQDKVKKEILTIKISNDKSLSVHKRFKEKIKSIILDINENPNKNLEKTKVIVFKMYKDLKIKLKEITEDAKKENYCKK